MQSCSQYRSEAARQACFAHLDRRARQEWPVSCEERTVPTSWGPTLVRISGPVAAPALVLLPGAAAPSLMWVPNVADLARECRIYAVDQIGDFGQSETTAPVRQFRDLAAWLDEVFQGLGLTGPIFLGGISYGGAIAAEYARQFPTRLAGAILLAPGATVLGLGFGFVLRLAGAALAHRRGLRSLFRWLFADAVRQQPAWLDTALAELDLYMRSVRRRLPFPRVWSDAEWGSLAVPALFLVGEHEKIYSAVKAVRRLRRVAPAVIAEIVTGCGHDLSFVQPSLVDQRILAFVRGITKNNSPRQEGLASGGAN